MLSQHKKTITFLGGGGGTTFEETCHMKKERDKEGPKLGCRTQRRETGEISKQKQIM